MKKTKQPKFKKGDKVFTEYFGSGIVYSSYKSKGKWLYQIKSHIFLSGNIPESFIFKSSLTKSNN